MCGWSGACSRMPSGTLRTLEQHLDPPVGFRAVRPRASHEGYSPLLRLQASPGAGQGLPKTSIAASMSWRPADTSHRTESVGVAVRQPPRCRAPRPSRGLSSTGRSPSVPASLHHPGMHEARVDPACRAPRDRTRHRCTGPPALGGCRPACYQQYRCVRRSPWWCGIAHGATRQSAPRQPSTAAAVNALGPEMRDFISTLLSSSHAPSGGAPRCRGTGAPRQ
jgi:hypothetical protein